jgi:hypothetical protein
LEIITSLKIRREIMKRFFIIILALSFILGACVGGGVVVTEPVYYPDDVAIKIPPGHMPPPGKCRIWYPDIPPGQQPPPGECRDLRHRVPPGAVIIYGK